MRIAILGAGGVGGYYGGILARAGHEVTLLARGPHLAAMRERGLEIRTPEGTFVVEVEAASEPKGLGHVDLAVVAVKNYSLPEVTPAARLLAKSGAMILPLLNGVEAADRLIASGVAGDLVLGGLTEISAFRAGPGIIERRSSFHKVVVGELAGGTSERTERVATAFREAGADARVSTDITADLWRKLAFIASTAAACGLSRTSIGPIRSSALGRLLIERAVREAVTVARMHGVRLIGDVELKIMGFVDSLAPELKPSFLLDYEAGGPTEIDDLSGAISRLGRQAGVETPVHDVATAVLGLPRPASTAS